MLTLPDNPHPRKIESAFSTLPTNTGPKVTTLDNGSASPTPGATHAVCVAGMYETDRAGPAAVSVAGFTRAGQITFSVHGEVAGGAYMLLSGMCATRAVEY
jgi:hypothetical protein